MDEHAFAILERADSWDWPPTLRTQESGANAAITPKLLSGFISESNVLGGTLLDQFWAVVAGCHAKLGANSLSRSLLPPRALS